MAALLYSIGHDVGGGYVLTIYEGENAATVELSPELAAQLASALTAGADQRNDFDDGAGLEFPAPVLTKEDLDGSNHLGSSELPIGAHVENDVPRRILD
ncbi:hypothetical protein [Burkholderia cenocepacia]|uniref:hypothetical protein n=1 Tax=Burkholderia cenocepacia TaxID=95486 RepID=UPI0012B6DF9C|nr:hypothetical protein [Burkholderia cenocepacia]